MTRLTLTGFPTNTEIRVDHNPGGVQIVIDQPNEKNSSIVLTYEQAAVLSAVLNYMASEKH